MNEIKKTSVFRHGHTQVVEIPSEFELPEGDVMISRDGDRLIIETKATKPKTFREMLDAMETIDVEFPDVDEGLLPIREVNL